MSTTEDTALPDIIDAAEVNGLLTLVRTTLSSGPLGNLYLKGGKPGNTKDLTSLKELVRLAAALEAQVAVQEKKLLAEQQTAEAHKEGKKGNGKLGANTAHAIEKVDQKFQGLFDLLLQRSDQAEAKAEKAD